MKLVVKSLLILGWILFSGKLALGAGGPSLQVTPNPEPGKKIEFVVTVPNAPAMVALFWGTGVSPDGKSLLNPKLVQLGTTNPNNIFIYADIVPQNLAGKALSFQALTMDGFRRFESTSILNVEFSQNGGGGVTGTIPADGSVLPTNAVIEIWVDRYILDATVNAQNILLTDSQGKSISSQFSLVEQNGKAVIVVQPARLPREANLSLAITTGLQDESGAPVGGTTNFNFSVEGFVRPFLHYSEAELQIKEARYRKKQNPWYSALDAVKNKMDKNRNVQPNVWPTPPNTDKAYRAFYADWHNDVGTWGRYAALCYRLTGDSKYLNIAKKMVNAWAYGHTPGIPKSSQSYWSIQYDIGGLAHCFTLDLIWDDLNAQDRAQQKSFLNQVAQVVMTHHLKSSATPGNIGTWNLALVLTVSKMFDQEELERWALFADDISNTWPGINKNPHTLMKQFNNSIDSKGEVVDILRGDCDGNGKFEPSKDRCSTAFKAATYPMYHLQAFITAFTALFRDGNSWFYLTNKNGSSLKDGYDYLVPFFDGTMNIAGMGPSERCDFGIDKAVYPYGRWYRGPQEEAYLNNSLCQPHYEAHFAKHASGADRIPSALAKEDNKGPGAVASFAVGTGATCAVLSWQEGAVGDEGDLAHTYVIFRDGVQIGKTSMNTFMDIDLNPGSTYEYEVKAVDYYSNRGAGQKAMATTLLVQ